MQISFRFFFKLCGTILTLQALRRIIIHVMMVIEAMNISFIYNFVIMATKHQEMLKHLLRIILVEIPTVAVK